MEILFGQAFVGEFIILMSEIDRGRLRSDGLVFAHRRPCEIAFSSLIS